MSYNYLYGLLKGETLDPPKMGYISIIWYNEILKKIVQVKDKLLAAK